MESWTDYIDKFSSSKNVKKCDIYDNSERNRKINGLAAFKEIDLHGLTLEEAKKELEYELEKAYIYGKDKLLIIHGRGNNSPNKSSVLKPAIREYLLHHKYVRKLENPIKNGGASPVIIRQ